MTAEQVMDQVRESMTKALRQFLGQPVTAQTKLIARAAILDVLHVYYNNGTIDTIPMVDINHETEIAALEKRYQEIDRQSSENGYQWAEAHNCMNRMSLINQRISDLKEQIKNPHSMAIFLKQPDSFKPYVWFGRSDYVN